MITDIDLFWLAGYLEGEGSFVCGPPSSPGSPIISVCSTDEDVIERVAVLFETKIKKNKIRNPKHKRVWSARKVGFHAVELMARLKPMMSARRQQQIQRAIDSYDKTKSHKLSADEIEAIRLLCSETTLKQQEIADRFCIRRETVNKIKNGKLHPLVEG